MNKSFYITATTVVLLMFIFCSVFLISLDNTNYMLNNTSLIMNFEASNSISLICIQLISGTFLNNTFNVVFEIVCVLLSAYLLFLVMRRTVTIKLALVMSYLYLAIACIGAYKISNGAFTCLLSAFLVYMYYLRYDGLEKWYIMLLTLSILAIHNSVFVIAMYLFPFFSYSRIKRQKTSWSAFVNMLVLLALAFLLQYQFVNGFPIDISTAKASGLKTFFNQLNVEKLVIFALFLIGSVGFLFCHKFIKGYVKFSVIYMIFYILSFMYFSNTGATFLMFLPPIYTSFAVVMCHLKVFRKNKRVFVLLVTLISVIIFASLLLFN